MTKDINERILDATLEVIAREKISGTRMHLIAKEAKMSQSNLHYHYKTKNELLITLMDNLQKRFSDKRMDSVDLNNKSFKDNLHGLFEEKKDDIINHKKVDYVQFDYWVQGTVNPEIRMEFQKTFEAWRNNIKEVLLQSKVSQNSDLKLLDMVSFIVVSLMMGASMQYLIDEGKFNLDEYFQASENIIFNFLG